MWNTKLMRVWIIHQRHPHLQQAQIFFHFRGHGLCWHVKPSYSNKRMSREYGTSTTVLIN